MKRDVPLSVILAVLWSAMMPQQSAIAQPRDIGTCGVTITSPENLKRVESTVLVKGRARVKPSAYVWVFARRRGLGIWWPQGGAAAAVADGQFSTLVTLGVPADVGAEFEIVAGIFDAAKNATLDAWFRETEKRGTYPGMPLPQPVQGCGGLASLLVTKAG